MNHIQTCCRFRHCFIVSFYLRIARDTSKLHMYIHGVLSHVHRSTFPFFSQLHSVVVTPAQSAARDKFFIINYSHFLQHIILEIIITSIFLSFIKILHFVVKSSLPEILLSFFFLRPKNRWPCGSNSHNIIHAMRVTHLHTAAVLVSLTFRFETPSQSIKKY